MKRRIVATIIITATTPCFGRRRRRTFSRVQPLTHPAPRTPPSIGRRPAAILSIMHRQGASTPAAERARRSAEADRHACPAASAPASAVIASEAWRSSSAASALAARQARKTWIGAIRDVCRQPKVWIAPLRRADVARLTRVIGLRLNRGAGDLAQLSENRWGDLRSFRRPATGCGPQRGLGARCSTNGKRRATSSRI